MDLLDHGSNNTGFLNPIQMYTALLFSYLIDGTMVLIVLKVALYVFFITKLQLLCIALHDSEINFNIVACISKN